MPTIVCPHCQATFDAPTDLTQAQCVRCGQVVEQISQAIQPFIEKPATAAMNATIELPERYASWEEFRSLSPAIQREMMSLATRAMPDMRRMKRAPLPADMPTAVDGLGRPLGSVSVPGDGMNKAGTWFICGGGLLLSIVGLAMFLIGVPRSRGESIGLIICGIFVALYGAAVRFSKTNQVTSTLWVFEEGLFLRQFGRSMAARWDEVRDFEKSAATGRPLFWINVANDMAVAISVGHSPQVVALMEFVEIRLSSAQLVRRLQNIWEGRRERFGSVILDRHGVQGPQFFAPWPDVRRVIFDANSLFVDWAGVENWSPIRYADVSFPYLVMAIAQVMIEEHRRFRKVDA
jgi:hypothetical protein